MPKDNARLFLAIVPPEPIFADISTQKEQLADEFESWGALKSPPHITLHMPFVYRVDRLDKLLGVLQDLGTRAAPFGVTLKDYQVFEPSVIFMDVLPNKALHVFQAETRSTMRLHCNIFNADYKDRPFHPHMTMLFRDLKKARFYEAWAILKEREITYQWIAREFAVLRHNGSKWEIYRNVPLKGA